MYKRLLTIGFVLTAFAGMVAVVFPPKLQAAPSLSPTFAATTVKCDPKTEVRANDYTGKEDKYSCCPKSAGAKPSGTACFMHKYINPVINLLAALVGVVVLASIVFGGIQYSASAGDPNKAAAARQRIINSLGALAAFVFLYAFLQWIIPGGI